MAKKPMLPYGGTKATAKGSKGSKQTSGTGKAIKPGIKGSSKAGGLKSRV